MNDLFEHIKKIILENGLAQAGLITVLVSGTLYKIPILLFKILNFIRLRITSKVVFYSFSNNFDTIADYLKKHIKFRHYDNISGIGLGKYYTFIDKKPTIVTISTDKSIDKLYYIIEIESFFTRGTSCVILEEDTVNPHPSTIATQQTVKMNFDIIEH